MTAANVTAASGNCPMATSPRLSVAHAFAGQLALWGRRKLAGPIRVGVAEAAIAGDHVRLAGLEAPVDAARDRGPIAEVDHSAPGRVAGIGVARMRSNDHGGGKRSGGEQESSHDGLPGSHHGINPPGLFIVAGPAGSRSR